MFHEAQRSHQQKHAVFYSAMEPDWGIYPQPRRKCGVSPAAVLAQSVMQPLLVALFTNLNRCFPGALLARL
jgi:hypothetical protein